MAHDVSLTYTRFDHMSPTAVGLATLLHVSVAAAFWWISPLHHADQTPDAIEITMEQEVQPPPPAPDPPAPDPPAPEPPVAQAPPPPPPPVQQQTPPRLGLRGEPIGTTMDPRAMLSAPQAAPKPEKPAEQPPEAAKPEPAKPEPAKPEAAPEPAKEPPPQQQAALAPQPPPPPLQPQLEKVLPPVEAPPPPVTSREIPRPAPPPPPPPPPKPPPQPAQRAPAPPPAARPPVAQHQPPSSPLSHLPQQHTPDSQQAARQTPSPFVNPAEAYGDRKVQEDYLWGVVRKISQHRYYPKSSRENSEEGVVVARITVSREGRLIDVAVARSSGYPTLDNALIEVIRQAAPYPPLPSDMSGDRHTFLLPLNYRRTDQ